MCKKPVTLEKHEQIAQCFSCDKDFILESQNDREEGYFCNACIDCDEPSTYVELESGRYYEAQI